LNLGKKKGEGAATGRRGMHFEGSGGALTGGGLWVPRGGKELHNNHRNPTKGSRTILRKASVSKSSLLGGGGGTDFIT